RKGPGAPHRVVGERPGEGRGHRLQVGGCSPPNCRLVAHAISIQPCDASIRLTSNSNDLRILRGGLLMMIFRSLALIAISAVFLPGSALAAYPGANGKLLYLDRSGELGAQLVTVNQDGTGKVIVTAGRSMEIHRASWSPDGSRIALTGYPLDSESSGRLFVTDPAGLSFQEIDIA